jgi:putative nrdI-like protein
MKNLTLVYISLSGNTKSFINRLEKILSKYYNISSLDIKELVHDNKNFYKLNNSFITFVPTYLEGGNGIDNGTKEILTTPLKNFISFEDNYKNCLGVVGSGNKNFNLQYCLTAKQYSNDFGFPLLDTFELRGNNEDLERVKNIILSIY